MPEAAPTLELVDASPASGGSFLTDAPMALAVRAGDCILIEAAERRRIGAFADLCAGLLPLASGAVRFEGIDWRDPPRSQVQALRGRIGRMYGLGNWIGTRETETEILLPRLHHTRVPREVLLEQALGLARRFGLPGLPVDEGAALAEDDAIRAAAVRAFLGAPSLLILENPLGGTSSGTLAVALLRAITEARERGAAAICLTRAREAWEPYLPFVTRHLRLHDGGLGRAGGH